VSECSSGQQKPGNERQSNDEHEDGGGKFKATTIGQCNYTKPKLRNIVARRMQPKATTDELILRVGQLGFQEDGVGGPQCVNSPV